MTNKIKKMLLCAGVALVAASCISDEQYNTVDPTANPGTVRFSLAIPGHSVPRPVTRALTEAQENAIGNVDVLAFYTSGADNGKLAYHKIGKVVQDKVLTFEVELPEGTYDLMVVGNAASEVAGAGLVPKTTTKTAAIAALTFTKTGKWDYTKPIPVWGYKNGVTVDEETSLTGEDAVDMHRMVARIDVALSTEAASGVVGGEGNANFELKEVYLANYNTVGQIAPTLTNLAVGADAINPGKEQAIDPSVPAAPGKQTGMADASPWAPAQLYDGTDVTPSAVTRTIYTFEAENGNAGSHSTNPCLVIGGSYRGEATSYYRVDFVTKSGETYNYLDILRNHNYTIAISKVTGRGYDTPKEAFDARSFNIEMNTLLWEDNGMSYSFNGQYILGVNQGSFVLSSDAYTSSSRGNDLTITTDYPGGWTAAVYDGINASTGKPEGTDARDWLSITPDHGDADYPSATSTKLILENNDSGGDRTGYVVIKAGPVTYVVKVTQRWQFLKVTDITSTEVEVIDGQRVSFPSAGGTRTLKVEWSPASDVVSVRRMYDDSKPSLTWTEGLPSTLSSGTATITIDPSAITSTDDPASWPFTSKGAELTFTRGTDKVTVVLDQTNYAILLDGFTNPTPASLTKTANVKSNFAWTMTINKSVAGDNITATPATGGPSTSTGQNFSYTFPSTATGNASFSFTPTDPGITINTVSGGTLATNKATSPTVSIVVLNDPVEGLTKVSGGGGTVLANSYVGAFWRHDQKGERLITIPITTNANAGIWAVRVYSYGGNGNLFGDNPSTTEGVTTDFKKGEILFSLDPSTDKTGDAESYGTDEPGKSWATEIMGNSTNPGEISFRIGLTSEWTPTTDKPARYAVIVISYGGRSGSYGGTTMKHQLLFLRQGEGDDYVMYRELQPGQVAGDNGAMDNRPLARKFSPFNLTAQDFLDSPESRDGAKYKNVGYKGGAFVQYPSQAGAHFRWAHTEGVWAYNPVATDFSWSTTNISGFWNTRGATYESCPEGYHRPSDGKTDAAYTSVDIADSEMFQSLYSNVTGTSTGNTNNSVWGRYADGYFDRQTIVNGVGSSAGATSAVNADNSAVAYMGRLFHNPTTHNSLFFPASGNRNNSYGALYNTGSIGYYWSSSSYSASYGWRLGFGSGSANRSYYSRYGGFSVRCVADE